MLFDLRGGSQPFTDLSGDMPKKEAKQSLVTVTFSPTDDDLDLSLSSRDPKLGNNSGNQIKETFNKK